MDDFSPINARPRKILRFIAATFVSLFGLSYFVGGAWLVLLGGAGYYAAAGIALATSGWFLWRDNPWAEHLFFLVLIVTLLWALAESGFDPWALTPRLLLPALLGVWVGATGTRRSAGEQIGGSLWLRPVTLASLLCLALLVLSFARLQFAVPSELPPQSSATRSAQDTDWPSYGNSIGGTRFAPLAQIAPDNVSKLQVAWIYRSGSRGPHSEAEATPIKIGSTLYTCTPDEVVVALDAASGRERWRFDPHIDLANYPVHNCRGVSFYRVPRTAGVCAARIISTTMDGRLLALDAVDGRRCRDFGRNGVVDLHSGLGRLARPSDTYATSPPTVAKNHIILGALVQDDLDVDMPSGVVRAYDPVSGALQWAWDVGAPGRRGAPAPGQSYTRSTPNAWSVFSADEGLNLVYVPTGNASPDFYGADRRAFDEMYSSSIVALDLDTGRPRWSFQTVHHDLWDYDVPAQPVLVDVPSANGIVPELVQATKTGDIYVLDRRSGKPLVPVRELAAPRSAAPGERPSLTQPASALTLRPAPLTEASMWGITPFDQLMCRIAFRQLRYDGIFTLIGVKPSIEFPGVTGTIDWGGLSVDEGRKIAVANITDFPFRMRLIPRKDVPAGAVPSFWNPLMLGTPYALEERPFLGPFGVPCLQPPWGSLVAIDLKAAKIIWKRRLGTAYDSGPFGLHSLLPLSVGVPSMGGTLATASGLVFVSGTVDRFVRAFSTSTGRELWQARLPAGGQATPMSYMSGGTQYVVVTAGGHFILGTKPGDYVIAYALAGPNRANH